MNRSARSLLAALLISFVAATAAAVGDGPILTPPTAPTPRINGPTIFGVRPGSPFLYSIPATGDRPMSFSADNLPAGLALDSATGRITGKLTSPGESTVTLRAKNARGEARKKFRIVVGEKISLTPALGWSSWNCFAHDITQQNILAMARIMASSGLKDHGWTYINIDDCWQGPRAGPFNALQGGAAFPNMQKLGDQIHALGLKFGVYSNPWLSSFAGYPGGTSNDPQGRFDFNQPGGHRIGQYSFLANDARQWAAWGVDYVKMDWGPTDIPHVREISEALRATGRDMVLSLSNGPQFNVAAEYPKYAQSLRIAPDMWDSWKVVDTPSHASVSGVASRQERWAPYTQPGFYADCDMFIFGWVSFRHDVRLTRITPDEQYFHMSMWTMLASPLILGCDLSRLDPFTMSLFTNDEVIDINQDALCKSAVRLATIDNIQIYVKELEDGSRAVGFFNLGDAEQASTCKDFATLGLKGKQHVRDLWRQKDLPDADGTIDVTVPAHGVLLYRFTPLAAG